MATKSGRGSTGDIIMLAFRLASAVACLLMVGACTAPVATQPVATQPVATQPVATQPAATQPVATQPVATPDGVHSYAVLVGHSDNPPTVILMTLDGSVIRTLPGVGLAGQHAVGAYLVVAASGSSKGWTVDAHGAVKDVAPAAVTVLSPSIDGGWTPPLIVNSQRAVIVRCANATCTANFVDLETGTVRPLLTAPQTSSLALGASLVALDVTRDGLDLWLGKLTSSGGASGELELFAIDILHGDVTSIGHANALAGAEIAIDRGARYVAGQEYFGINSSNLAIRHLHVVSLGTDVDLDVQGSAPYVGGQRPPSVLFAPGGEWVAWWGGLDNGSRTFLVNVAPVGGSGRILYNPTQTDFSGSLSGVFWANPSTLVVQNGVETYTIDASTGSQTLISQKLNYLDAVIEN